MESNNPYASTGSASDMPPQRGWWARNWKWFVPVLVIVLLLPCCVCGGLIMYMGNQWHQIEPFPQAMQVIRQSPEVQAALGTPIEIEGFPSQMQVNYHNSTGDAEAQFHIAGPSNGAAVVLEATYDGTQWTFDVLSVVVDTTNETIDLSGAMVSSGTGQQAPVSGP